jgi:hypothetical protein
MMPRAVVERADNLKMGGIDATPVFAGVMDLGGWRERDAE